MGLVMREIWTMGTIEQAGTWYHDPPRLLARRPTVIQPFLTPNERGKVNLRVEAAGKGSTGVRTDTRSCSVADLALKCLPVR